MFVRSLCWGLFFVFAGLQVAEAKQPRVLQKGWKKKAKRLQKTRRCLWLANKGRKDAHCRRYAKQDPQEAFLVVIARSRRLLLCRGGRLLQAFSVGHGRRGFGKQREGDKKTPLGSYRISWMAARHEPRRDASKERSIQRFQIRSRRAYCMRNPNTNISEFRRDKGPRDERLWLRPYGGHFAAVMALDYPNAPDQKSGRTGSCIEIHASYHLNGSAGCITLLPHRMIALYNCLSPQTRVEIVKR
ncbi:MAG: L,D-transpeptidase family protein [Myxococcales bacterium]|nr:L,D-transpeptidase family protein [Myxococcales bacterium]